jgi:hypothetical protein
VGVEEREISMYRRPRNSQELVLLAIYLALLCVVINVLKLVYRKDVAELRKKYDKDELDRTLGKSRFNYSTSFWFDKIFLFFGGFAAILPYLFLLKWIKAALWKETATTVFVKAITDSFYLYSGLPICFFGYIVVLYLAWRIRFRKNFEEWRIFLFLEKGYDLVAFSKRIAPLLLIAGIVKAMTA